MEGGFQSQAGNFEVERAAREIRERAERRVGELLPRQTQQRRVAETEKVRNIKGRANRPLILNLVQIATDTKSDDRQKTSNRGGTRDKGPGKKALRSIAEGIGGS